MNLLPVTMFWVLGIIWGSNFIYMKLAADLITPVQIVLWRVVFGFIPVAVYALYKRELQPGHFKHFFHILVMAVVATIGYYYGFAKGTSLLLSGVSGALSGLTPIMSFLLAVLLLSEEKATFHRMAGILIGFAGVLFIARPFGADLASTNIEGAFYNVVGSFCVGASFVYAKKYVLPLNIPVSALLTYQLGLSLMILLLVVDLDGIGAIWSDSHAAAGLVLGLGLLGTGMAYIIYYYIIEKLGAVVASSVSYIPPVIALAIGAVIVGEDISIWDYAGTLMIFVGVMLVNRKKASA